MFLLMESISMSNLENNSGFSNETYIFINEQIFPNSSFENPFFCNLRAKSNFRENRFSSDNLFFARPYQAVSKTIAKGLSLF